ncbi:hypothetical protein [Oceanobacillus sp. J11TS1]|uniref:hypothetical protein n=1 Tax=Oceanobacillus sp. J11TS1 TaxID=2807191 RepID=UPI001B190116|nr:hypothetical protein [Oceanobacillus sp. J11TS1]GIO22893.1 hypothetical protein J11TS1_14740 [Oceanobacillus sp. J11TS1]
MLNIKYDIVGSFLRPEEIKHARASYFNREMDLKALREVEDQAIADLVEKQVEHGLKVVTDAQMVAS